MWFFYAYLFVHTYIFCIHVGNSSNNFSLYSFSMGFSILLNHHHVVLPARISLTLPRHFSLSFIASGRSSGIHPVSSHSCCMYGRAGRPAFAWPYAGVHRSTSLMSSSLLLQQCPACLVRLSFSFIKCYFLYRIIHKKEIWPNTKF